MPGKRAADPPDCLAETLRLSETGNVALPDGLPRICSRRFWLEKKDVGAVLSSTIFGFKAMM